MGLVYQNIFKSDKWITHPTSPRLRGIGGILQSQPIFRSLILGGFSAPLSPQQAAEYSATENKRARYIVSVSGSVFFVFVGMSAAWLHPREYEIPPVVRRVVDIRMVFNGTVARFAGGAGRH